MSLSAASPGHRLPTRLTIIAVLAGFLIAFSAGCAAGSTEVQPQPDPDPDPEGQADPQPDPEPGLVEPPPEGAAQVTVQLSEWSVSPEPALVAAGRVYFLAQNVGGEPHELVIIRSDEAPDALPVEDGKVPEDEVDFIGEIEAFAADSEASGVFELTPGTYILLCNIVEQEESGELESHYQNGMAARFTVGEAKRSIRQEPGEYLVRE